MSKKKRSFDSPIFFRGMKIQDYKNMPSEVIIYIFIYQYNMMSISVSTDDG